MDLEDLNKTQIILIVLLVSFVTSIATGIVTVSLLQRAPPAITQTVNRIVERTVETVVPRDTGPTQITTKETTVVVKEDDLITDAIAASLTKTGRVFSGTATSTPIVGLAAQISATTLITDASIVGKEHLVALGDTMGIFTVSQRFPEIGIAVLSEKSTTTVLAAPFRIADVSGMKLGQTVTALVSVASERVAIGAIAARYAFTNVSSGSADPISVRALDTTIGAGLSPGAPLINIFGDLIGIETTVAQVSPGVATFIAASDIAALLVAPKATSTPLQ
ncbi:hypothetical protein A2841_00715 [Candidatus Kaiserbacteria bacterium RIFCSPHIGHO2_01_FULL_48_10]|uniref:Uncharacterized protein n=1 Tax=Candidatus Kaiserbacteria bacterium RIFCSPHIGHO2_01_FULL_48_10 TaxID=1798476 RepID=A0A1F6C663_9BACT|nr:MAG: hypothetical protein A2841_00715 [Candidatus Kaiserbacteria bacterium RIFCSPHIGHO2_01_FULL_48_10]